MIVINNPSEIKNFINKPLTPSEWYHVTQEKINKFADATSDHQWIHVDEKRAKKKCLMEKQLRMDIIWSLFFQN